jgi:hypothetical protein
MCTATFWRPDTRVTNSIYREPDLFRRLRFRRQRIATTGFQRIDQ